MAATNCERVEEEESSHTLPFHGSYFLFYQNCIFEDFFCYGSNQHSSKAHPDLHLIPSARSSTTFWCNIDLLLAFPFCVRERAFALGNNEKLLGPCFQTPFGCFLLEIGGFTGLDALLFFSCWGRLWLCFCMYS
jgi:hypothetical protein